MIHFSYVRWKNFLSTGNTFIEIQLDRNPTTLIIGENGAGKSTILDALCFSLFGKPFRMISKNQMINSINNSSTIVEVEFNIGSRKYKVVRGIKPNKFEIYQNNILMNQNANARDYQKILEQSILGLNYRSFTQVVILGSSTFIPFMQLRTKHRRQVVEEILDIQIFSTMNMLLKSKIKDIIDDIREAEHQHDLMQNKISMQENHIKDMKENKDKIIQEKQSLIKENESELLSRKTLFKNLKDTNRYLLESLLGETKVMEKKNKLGTLKHSITEKQSRAKKMIKFFEENSDCPTCEQHIDEDFKSKAIDDKLKESRELTIGLGKLSDEIAAVDDKIIMYKNLTKKMRDNEVLIAQTNTSMIELEKYNTKIKTELGELEKDKIGKNDIEKLDEYKNNLEKVIKHRSKLREDKLYAEVSKTMLQDTGIKTKIIKQYLPIMNKLINKYLTSMEFYVNFTLDENFEETIKSRYRDEFTYSSFSEGEKMRIDLALLFTWRAIAKMKNSVNTNLLMLDEIFDSSLDGTGTDEFLKILNTLSGENVFVISHKQDALADKFRSTLKFEKIRNFSHVVT